MLFITLIVAIALMGKVFAEKPVLSTAQTVAQGLTENHMFFQALFKDKRNLESKKFDEVLSSVQEGLKAGLRPAAVSTTTASSWFGVTYYQGATCSSSAAILALAVGVGQCYPTTSSSTFVMITVSGSTATLTTYPSNACSGSSTNVYTTTLNSCIGAATSGYQQQYLVVTSQSGFGSASGALFNYYDTQADCNNNANVIYGFNYYAYQSGSCVWSLPGSTSSYSVGCPCSGQVNLGIYSSSATCGGTASSSGQVNANTLCSSTNSQDVPSSLIEIPTYGPYFTCTGGAGGSCSTSSSSSCFAGSESVQLESGATVPIADVRVGDKVLAYSSAEQTTVFSDVVAVPHVHNDVQADFQHIVLASGADIKMTAEHLLPSGSCSLSSLPLARAADVQVGDCVQTTEGQSTVVSNSVVTGNGVYTIVTEKADFVVVNGVVASPFAVNHAVANFVYGFHRMVYGIAPKMVAPISGVLSSLAAYFTK